MTSRTTVAVVVAVAALGLAGCKTSTGSTPAQPAASVPVTTAATPTPEAATSSPPATTDSGSASAGCLISAAEASAALGGDAGTPTVIAQECDYKTSGGSLTVISTSYGAAAVGQFFDGNRSATSSLPGFQDVTGVGDRAFLSDGLMVFIKGPTLVTIDVGHDPPPTAEAMTTLGKAAASRV